MVPGSEAKTFCPLKFPTGYEKAILFSHFLEQVKIQETESKGMDLITAQGHALEELTD